MTNLPKTQKIEAKNLKAGTKVFMHYPRLFTILKTDAQPTHRGYVRATKGDGTFLILHGETTVEIEA